MARKLASLVKTATPQEGFELAPSLPIGVM